MLIRFLRFSPNGYFISWGYRSLPVLAVFRKLFKNFIRQNEPIWIWNTCDNFSISSVYFLIFIQIRIKSFHLKWYGYALKWMEKTDLTCRGIFFFLVTKHITLSLLVDKGLYWKHWGKEERTELCDSWFSWGAGCRDLGPVQENAKHERTALADPGRRYYRTHIVLLLLPITFTLRCFAQLPAKEGRSPAVIYDELFLH